MCGGTGRVIHLGLNSFQQGGGQGSVRLGSAVDHDHSDVSGDIGLLSCLSELESLNAAQTSITGELGQLTKLTKLKMLHLSDTVITGDVSDLGEIERSRSVQHSRDRQHRTAGSHAHGTAQTESVQHSRDW
eukprot:COSAG05_NODE_4452_length_1509_cov_0.966667_2_plen_131_part_00